MKIESKSPVKVTPATDFCEELLHKNYHIRLANPPCLDKDLIILYIFFKSWYG